MVEAESLPAAQAVRTDIPPALEEFADAIVGWNTENIENALSGESVFVNSDGSPRASVTGSRGVC